MALISAEKAFAALNSHLEPLWEIVKGGWDDYLALYNDRVRIVHGSVTRAGIVHDHQIDRASRYCITARGLRLIELAGGLKVLFAQTESGNFAIRLKKLNVKMRSTNQNTKQVEDFIYQRQLTNLPDTYNLDAGYVLDALGTQIVSVNIVCPNGEAKPHWSASLSKDSITQNIFDLFEGQQEEEVEEEEDDKETHVGGKKNNNVIPFSRENDGKD